MDPTSSKYLVDLPINQEKGMKNTTMMTNSTTHQSSLQQRPNNQKNDNNQEDEDDKNNQIEEQGDGNGNNQKSDAAILLTIQSELQNMGKALTCPVCLSTVRQPVLLSCIHVFCQECIRTEFQHNQSNKQRCPVCTAPCTKRSMVRNYLLEEIVKGFKLTVKSFGFAPVVYDKNVGMTQIEEEVSFSINDDDNYDNQNGDKYDGTNNKMGTKKLTAISTKSDLIMDEKKKVHPPSLQQCHEHLEVSRAFRNVLKQAMNENTDVNNEKDESKSARGHNSNSHSHNSLEGRYSTGDTTISDDTSNSPTTTTIATTSKEKRKSLTSSINTTTTDNNKTIQSNASTKTKTTMSVQEQMEWQNKKKKLSALLKDQEQIIQVDEKALVRAAVQKQTTKKRTSLSSSLGGDSSNNINNICSSGGSTANKNNIDYNDKHEDLSLPTTILKQSNNINDNNDNDTNTSTNNNDKSNVSDITHTSFGSQYKQDEGKRTEDNDNTDKTNPNFPQSPSIESSILRHAKKTIEKSDKLLSENMTQSQAFYSVADENSIPFTAAVQEVVPNNERQKNSIIMTSQEAYEITMDDLREKEVADRSMEELECVEEQSSALQEDSISRNNNNNNNSGSAITMKKVDNPNTSQLSEHFLTAPSQNIDQSNEQERRSNNNNTAFAVGNIVVVQARTWPGVNKPGGAARITKIHSQSGAAGLKYDVTYILGGKEKLVDELFIKEQKEVDIILSQNRDNQNVTSSTSNDASNITRKSRRVGERKMVEKWIEEIDQQIEQNKADKKEKEEILKKLDVASIKKKVEKIDIKNTRKIKKTKDSNKNLKKDEECDENIEQDAIDEKEIESNMEEDVSIDKNLEKVTESSTSRKRRNIVEVDADQDSKKKTPLINRKRRKESIEKSEVTTKKHKKLFKVIKNNSNNIDDIMSLGFDEIERLALTRYKSLFSGESNKTINITVSSISDNDQKLLNKLCKLSNKHGQVKILNDFHIQKSHICVTAPSQKNDMISKLRTVKTMRAALAGIPIVSSKWITHCIENGEVTPPSTQMYIHTLPTKETCFMDMGDANNEGFTAIGGIFNLGVRCELANTNENVDKHLFAEISVHLCGDGWKKSPAKTKDVQLLLKESGATILKSAKDVTNLLKQNSKSTLILLCDGDINSVSSTFPQALNQALNSVLKYRGEWQNQIQIVNSTWLFDCISCARMISARHYKPNGSLAESLWLEFLPS